MNFAKRFRVKPGQKVRLSDWDPGCAVEHADKEHAESRLPKLLEQLAEQQYKLYADNRFALLIVLQAMDAGGKDGLIRRVMSCLNPQGCRVTSFKAPTPDELKHDFLWRVHAAVPPRGEIGIFNRSHYEDVLIARVHNLVDKPVWKKRYAQINDFERMLSENRVHVLKFFLHISKDEQKKRFLKRLKDPARNWKFSPADVEERKYWGKYTAAYEDALGQCNAPWAPWYVIPSDHKWFRDVAVAEIVLGALKDLKLRFPPSSTDLSRITVR